METSKFFDKKLGHISDLEMKQSLQEAIDNQNKVNEIERRRKMFHWFVDGLGSVGHLTPENKIIYSNRHGLTWDMYDSLTPDWVSKHYNVNL